MARPLWSSWRRASLRDSILGFPAQDDNTGSACTGRIRDDSIAGAHVVGSSARTGRASGTPAPTSEERQYVVKKGDTLWDIAAQFTGNPHNYRGIALTNGIADPDLIRARSGNQAAAISHAQGGPVSWLAFVRP